MVSRDVADLSIMARQHEFVAEDGHRGEGWRRRGRKGEDLAIAVPVGTIVLGQRDSGEEVLIGDLTTPGQTSVVARGGRGGPGNAHFATAVNQAPEIAGKGKPGEERRIVLELKLMTDICIVGPPNSGKSTLLSAVSRAKPEIADYPFTTRWPVLGVVTDDRRDYIVAELPGLVKGAHLGKGLGNSFLRHVERTKLLIYLLDGSSATVVEDFSSVEEEIASYGALSRKPRVLAVNKIDLPEVQARLPEVKLALAPIVSRLGVPVFYISAVSGRAVLELLAKAKAMVEEAGQSDDSSAQSQAAVFRPRPRK